MKSVFVTGLATLLFCGMYVTAKELGWTTLMVECLALGGIIASFFAFLWIGIVTPTTSNN